VSCYTGPAVGPHGRGHVHAVHCQSRPMAGIGELVRDPWMLAFLALAGLAIFSPKHYGRAKKVGLKL